MRGFSLPIKDGNGSILVVSMLVLSLLSMIGIAATTTSTIETQIATNDRIYKDTFYRAEGGLELAQELLEQNIRCPNGFTATEVDDSAKIEGTITVEPSDDYGLAFWQNPTEFASLPTDNNRDVYITQNDGTHTNLTFGGKTHLSPGGSLQMAAGYEGIGKGAAGGGADILYDIHAQHLGKKHSETTLTVKWRHKILPADAGGCNY